MRLQGRLARVLISIAMLSCTIADTGNAQYMYLDADADSINGTGDELQPIGTPTTVDVWIITNQNRDASAASCSSGLDSLSINSYEVILHAVGGAVTYGSVTNRMDAHMSTEFGHAQDSTA